MSLLYRLSAGICIITVSFLLIHCSTGPNVVPAVPVQTDKELSEGQGGDQVSGTGNAADRSDELSGEIPSEKDLQSFASLLNSEIRPVLDYNGKPLMETWQRDGRIYGAVLCVQNDGEYRFPVLSDLSRMYEQESRQFFYVANIQGYRGKVFLAYITELGDFPVIDRYSAAPFGNASAPVALNVGFQTGEGGEEIILFLNEREAESIRLRQNSASYAQRRDLDGDGINDVLLYEAIYEEGTGKETFVSWYRWDGKGLSIYQTTTIVRRLNEYLRGAADLLEEHSFDRFISRYVAPPEKQSLLLTLPFEEAFHRLFSPDRQMSVHVPLDRGAFASIRRVAFPNILENPFNVAAKEYSVELPVHFIADRDYRYTVRLLMDSNPFKDRPFNFVPRQP